MLREPSLDDLESRAADIGAPGSDYYNAVLERVRTLVQFGDIVRPNDPEISFAEVREVQLVGDPPYTQAVVTVCDVSNDMRVTPAENAPSGTESRVGEDAGRLVAALADTPMVLTDRGWVRTDHPLDGEVWIGADTCLA
jgi:hypothetical protein